MDYLRNIPAEHNRKARPKAVRLSEVLSRSMTGRIEKNYEKYGQIADTFEEILGPQLSEHCRPINVAAGQLKVAVSSPSYLYELKLCSVNMLAEIKRLCPEANIKKIKFVLDN